MSDVTLFNEMECDRKFLKGRDSLHFVNFHSRVLSFASQNGIGVLLTC